MNTELSAEERRLVLGLLTATRDNHVSEARLHEAQLRRWDAKGGASESMRKDYRESLERKQEQARAIEKIICKL